MADDRLSAAAIAQRLGIDERALATWQSLGLVQPDAEGRFDARCTERTRMVRFAVERGVAAEDIARLSEARGTDVLDDYIDLLRGARPPGRSVEDTAAVAGVGTELARRFRIAAGLSDDEVFDDDLEMLRAAATAVSLGLPEEAVLQLVRVLGDSMARIADAETRLFHIYVHERLRAAGHSHAELVEVGRSLTDPLTALIEPAILYFHRRAWTHAMLDDMVVHLRDDLAPAGGEVGAVPLAVLFVDLASFTPLTEAMGDTEAARVLDRFSELVREAAGACRGRVLKQIGDEFMVVFPSSAAAVNCGLAIRRAAAREPQFPAVRIGAHSGTALYREADYFGATVNIAARVASEAGRGEFLVTDAVHLAAGELPDVRFDRLGARALKGVADPIGLVAAIDAGEGAARAVDPVCGMDVDNDRSAFRVAWDGRGVVFCSEQCRTRFLAEPARYDHR